MSNMTYSPAGQAVTKFSESLRLVPYTDTGGAGGAGGTIGGGGGGGAGTSVGGAGGAGGRGEIRVFCW